MASPPTTSQFKAVHEFNTHESRTDGARVVASLLAGMDTLSDLIVDRVAIEPGTMYGVDSMIMPTSFVQGHAIATLEIELLQIVQVAEAAHAHNYLRTADDWFTRWLVAVRLPERWNEPAVISRLAVYKAQPADARRLSFETALQRALPQSAQAPLALFRLFPLAVDIATAIAFGGASDAAAGRKQQREVLPNLADCTECRGALLENGEECRQCGNPLWKFSWLTAE